MLFEISEVGWYGWWLERPWRLVWMNWGRRSLLVTLAFIVVFCGMPMFTWWVRAFSTCQVVGTVFCDVSPYQASVAKPCAIICDVITVFPEGDSNCARFCWYRWSENVGGGSGRVGAVACWPPCIVSGAWSIMYIKGGNRFQRGILLRGVAIFIRQSRLK